MRSTPYASSARALCAAIASSPAGLVAALHVPPLPDDALDRLRAAGFRMAVCTNKMERLALPLLERLELTTYFAAIHAAGPRITAVLFSLAAPFGLILGYFFLGEVVNGLQGAGIALILGGIVMAVMMADPGDRPTRPLWQGVGKIEL